MENKDNEELSTPKNSILQQIKFMYNNFMLNGNNYVSENGLKLPSVFSLAGKLIREAISEVKTAMGEVKEDFKEFLVEMRTDNLDNPGNINDAQSSETVINDVNQPEEPFDKLGITGCKTPEEYHEKALEASKKWDEQKELRGTNKEHSRDSASRE